MNLRLNTLHLSGGVGRLHCTFEFIVDFVCTISCLLMLRKFRIIDWGSAFGWFSFGVNNRLLNLGGYHFACKLIELKLRLVIHEQAPEHVSAIFDGQNTFANLLALNESTCVNESILFEDSFALWYAPIQVSTEFTAIFVVDCALSMGLIILEDAPNHISIPHAKLSFALTQVLAPQATVVLFCVVALAIATLALAMAFTIEPATRVLHTTLVSLRALPCHFTLNELANEA